jgi:hypothetical protein
MIHKRKYKSVEFLKAPLYNEGGKEIEQEQTAGGNRKQTHQKQEVKQMQITFKNPITKWGWTIESQADIITALMGYSAFDTVYSGFLQEALEQAAAVRAEYEDIEDLARELLENYL